MQRNKWYQQVFKGGGSSGSLHLIHSEQISFSVAVVKRSIKCDKVVTMANFVVQHPWLNINAWKKSLLSCILKN